jgi:hypothetical protein
MKENQASSNPLKQMNNLLEEINQAHTKNKHINFFLNIVKRLMNWDNLAQ